MGELPIQNPTEEFTERVGETGAGAIVMPYLIGMDDFRRNQHAARNRVKESNEVLSKLLRDSAGMETQEADTMSATDDMGDIIYTGDITMHPGQRVRLGKHTVIEADEEPPAPEPESTKPEVTKPKPPTPTPCEPTPTESMWDKLRTPALVLALGGGSALAGAAINYWLTDRPQVVRPNEQADWPFDIQVHPKN